jgi:tetratricopeptide (TPR) repeat protein
VVLVGAGAWAYANTLGVPFVFDDIPAISGNGTLGSLVGSLAPPQGLPVSGRPLLNLTFALNFAIGGMDVRGYHVFNLCVHILGGLVLFGLALRTLAKPALVGRFGRDRLPLALAIAALWLLHPISTEAVTYVSQRAESLMALFYLGTLYFFVVGEASPRPAAWWAASVALCLFGGLTKEVMATVPLAVLLYDRTFCAGSYAEAMRRRWRYYACLVAALLPLFFLFQDTGGRGVGFRQGVGAWSYALASCRSVSAYLGLSVWPYPLVFDYGRFVPVELGDMVPQAAVLAALLGFTLYALVRSPVVGFACAWFLVILAPTTSFIPLAYQPMAEHRVYLPLVAIVSVFVLGLHRLLGRRSAVVLPTLAVLLGFLTYGRNETYRSELSLWTDTVAKEPGNARAHANLGVALAKIPGREKDAIAEYESALQMDTDYAEAHNDLGLLLASSFGRFQEAADQFQSAIRIRPNYVEARDNLGMTLAALPGHSAEAIAAYEAALKIDPTYAKAHNDLGVALAGLPGRLPEAIEEFEEALRLRPDNADARNNLATARQTLAGH